MPVAEVGQFLASGGTIISGVTDVDTATTNFANLPMTGIYSAADTRGRIEMTLNSATTVPGMDPAKYAVYLTNGGHAFIITKGSGSTETLLSGSAQLQGNDSFSDVSMQGAVIGYENVPMSSSMLGTNTSSIVGDSISTLFRIGGDGNGNCQTTNADVGGIAGVAAILSVAGENLATLNKISSSLASTGTGFCTVAENGRGVLTYPASASTTTASDTPSRVFYLAGPGRGYFMETGYAALGKFEPQASDPASMASFAGMYTYSPLVSAKGPTNERLGLLDSDGRGTASFQLDDAPSYPSGKALSASTSTANYILTDSVAGRFMFSSGGEVFYRVSSDRYVSLDTDLTGTSASVSVMERAPKPI